MMAMHIGIVGAGLGGSMMALYLARDGHRVEVFESRRDPRVEDISETSMNLGLSYRGLAALRALDLADEVMALAIPMAGRVIHPASGGRIFQAYGRRQGEGIQAIRRGDINAILVAAASAHPGVQFHFQSRCQGLERDAPLLRVTDSAGQIEEHRFDFLIGADGVFSTLRGALQRGLPANYSQDYLPWGWKELTIPPAPDGGPRMEKNAFHLWPRGGSMMFAHPNRDGSFTCSLVLPWSGPGSFEALADGAALRRFFAATFPDLGGLLPDLEQQFRERPVIPLVTVRTSPWSYRDRVVLLGDSAHAVVPFYAQGMNSAFEDCATLADCLRRHGTDRRAAFVEYEAIRRPNTDALSEMSKENFEELRDGVRSPWLRAHKRLNLFLHRLLGARWMPLHARVTNTSSPYARARQLDRRQNRILAGVGLALAMVVLWSLLHVLTASGG
ncbi:MAG TPA: NAD(P)/FAD-dependent oxidoreductase [Thermoanaerobaculia bacterium]|nr:NAD(P)/FAD-dependent oxidoreductase [Thermoanaerobaculia bacterium]